MKVRNTLADAVVGGDERAFRVHGAFDSGGEHTHIGEQWREERIRQVVDGLPVRLWDQEAMPGEKRAIVEECKRVLVLKNPKPVVLANNLAEGAVFIEGQVLRTHTASQAINWQAVSIRPARKREGFST